MAMTIDQEYEEKVQHDQEYQEKVEQFVQETLGQSCTSIKLFATQPLIDVAPPCTCVQCRQQFLDTGRPDVVLTYAIILEAADAQLILNAWMAQMTDDTEYLRKTLRERGNSVVNRWLKKSGHKREEFLKAGAGNISHQTYPYLRINGGQESTAEKHETRNVLLHPHLSQEDFLANKMKIFRLLYARITYGPEQWFAFDLSKTKMAWESGELEIEYCNQSVIAHGASFGQLVAWKADQVHRMDTVGYPRACVVFEAQATQLRFLRSTVEAILGEAGQESTSEVSKWQQLIDNDFRTANEVEIISGLGTQAFGTPPIFDIQAILDTAKANLQEAEDKVSLLQTDPAHAHEEVRCLQDTRFSESVGKDKFFDYAGWVLMEAAKRVQLCHHVVEECEYVKRMFEHHSAEIAVGSDLPKEAGDALLGLRVMLTHILVLQMAELRNSLHRTKAFEHYFVTYTETTDRLTTTGFRLKPECSKPDMKQDPLFWSLWSLNPKETAEITSDLDLVLDCFEDCLEAERRAGPKSSRLDEGILYDVSVMASLWKILQKIELARPACPVVGLQTIEQDACIIGSDRLFWRLLKPQLGIVRPKYVIDPAIGRSLKTFAATAMPKGKKDEKWLAKSEKVRHNLRQCWDLIRKTQEVELRAQGAPAKACNMLLGWTAFDSAPEYLAKLEAEHQQIRNPKPKTNPKNDLGSYEPQNESSWTSTAAQTTTLPSKEPKKKTKTRPEPAHINEGEPQVDAPVSPTPSADELIQVSVTKESLRVVPKAFRAGTDIGQIHWNSWVKALGDAGFEAQNVGGSAVRFSSDARSIVFHKPHPDLKMGWHRVDAMAKRLTKHFGWTEETFVLRDKAADQ